MKKIFKKTLVPMICVMLLLTGCSGENNSNTSEKKVLADEEMSLMHSDADSYKGYEVSFKGKIFLPVEHGENGLGMQVYADPTNNEMNMIVYIDNPNIDVGEDDYISVTGIVKGEMKGENAFGAELRIPKIQASQIKKIDYIEACSKTLRTIDLYTKYDQYGCVIYLDKLELAENETRLYMHLENNSGDDFDFYKYASKIVVGNKQIELQSNYDANYPEFQTELLSGTKSSGILTFEPMNVELKELRLIFEASNGNYGDMQLDDYEFLIDTEAKENDSVEEKKETSNETAETNSLPKDEGNDALGMLNMNFGQLKAIGGEDFKVVDYEGASFVTFKSNIENYTFGVLELSDESLVQTIFAGVGTEIGDINVGMTPEEIVKIMGMPMSMGDDEMGENGYLTYYEFDEYSLSFSSLDQNSPTEYAIIRKVN